MSVVRRLALGLLSAGLYALAMPPFPLWPLAFVALVPLFAAVRGLSLAWTVRIGVLWGVAVGATGIHWLALVFGARAIAVWMVLGAFWGWSLALVRKLGLTRPEAPATPLAVALVAAACWTGVEYVRAELFILKFGIATAGSSQIAGPFLPAFAVIGLPGMSFLVVAVNVLAASAVRSRKAGPAWAAAGLLAVAGVLSLCPAGHQESGEVNVALVQAESVEIADLRALTDGRGGAPVDLIVWPEYSMFRYPLGEPALHAELAAVSTQHHATFVYGALEKTPEGFYDTVFAHRTDGTLAGRFHKLVPIPLFNDGLPGQSFDPIDTPAGRLGVMICYDSDFPFITRRITAGGAELLVVPTLDAASWGAFQHRQRLELCRARAVESGRWLVRTASSGVSAIIDPAGKVHARLDSGRGVLSGRVRRATGLTPYVRGGWMLAPICLAIALVITVRRAAA